MSDNVSSIRGTEELAKVRLWFANTGRGTEPRNLLQCGIHEPDDWDVLDCSFFSDWVWGLNREFKKKSGQLSMGCCPLEN